MSLSQKIQDVQKILQEHQIDGWLLYDFERTNPLACDFLEIPPKTMLTRRFWVWIPKKGEPVSLIHAVETHVLAHVPGKKLVYAAWKLFHAHLKELLHGKKTVAMEYSPRGNIPSASKVDGGAIDFIRELGVQVVSSASFLQYFNCVWTNEQYQLHKEAALLLDKTAANAWHLIGDHLKQNKPLTEYDVQQFILQEMRNGGCLMDSAPICAVNENSANPHYSPSKNKSKQIQKGDFVLIDLWCKRDVPHAVYADITRVAVAAAKGTTRHQEVFQTVRNAQKAATDYIQNQVEKKLPVKGCDVDNVARKVIEDAGFGQYFTHRTGHNIHEDVHGPGANNDGFETQDERLLIPRTCCSIEPGIYLPGEFGVRLEHDVYIHDNHKIEITGGIEDKLVALF